MGVEKPKNWDFIIKDNVLVGHDEPLSTDYKNVGELLLDKMKAKPAFKGQIDVITKATYTFAEMYDLTVKCALWLRKQGIKRNDVVALCSQNIMDSFAPFFATFCVGAIFTPWNSAMDIREARYLMKLSCAKIVFADEGSINTILEAAKLENSNIKIVVLGKSSKILTFSQIIEGHSRSEIDHFKCTPIEDIQETTTILYSSGTTGPPKGVELSHYAILYNLLAPSTLSTQGVPLWLSGYIWISGVLLTLRCIVNYCTRLINVTYQEEMTCKIIEKFKVTWLFLSSSMVNRIMHTGYFQKYDMSSLRFVFLGGSKFSDNSQIKFQECVPKAIIIQIYGMTELCGAITTQKPYHKAGTVGTVARNAQIKIVDQVTGKTLGCNQAGELLAKSLTMTKGYFKNPQATKETIDNDGWIHSGDLAYYDEDGEITIIDRIKETIKYRGMQISPCEIETLLHSHENIVEAAVVGIPHFQDDQHPLAFVTKVPGSMLTEQDVEQMVRQNLPDHYQLRGGVKFLEKMPYTATGKISRKDLKLIK